MTDPRGRKDGGGMDSIITFEERYALERKRRQLKPFSAPMRVRTALVCPSCGDEYGGYGNCWNKKHKEQPYVFALPADRVIVSYGWES